MSFVLSTRERLDSWAGRAPVTSVHESQQRWRDTEIGEETPPDEDEMVDISLTSSKRST